MTPQPIRVQEPIRFGEDFELDVTAHRLRRGDHALKLERIPLEILILLLEHRGETLTRDEIVAKIWGKDVFLDTDNSIRGAIRKIRQVLKDDAEQPRFIQTITGQGYRFIAPVISYEEEKGRDVSTVEEEKEHRLETLVQVDCDQRPRTLPTVRWRVLGVAAGVALLGMAYVVFRGRSTDATPTRIKSLAVLPLRNLSRDPAQEYFADGMTEEVIGRLSTIHGLRVISRTSVMRFKDTREPVPEIAKKLGVDAIVEGSVIREGNRVRVHAQLIRAATDEHFWSESYDREIGDVLTLQSNVARSIAEKVRVTMTGQEHSQLAATRYVAPEVYENYLKGQSQLSAGNSRPEIEKSLAFFQEAIRQDPSFAPAYVGLAAAYDTLAEVFVGVPPGEVRSKAIEAARKALDLDPELAEPHTVLGDLYQQQWRWSEAEAEYRQALELNPNDASAQLGLAGWLMCQGRTEDALDWSRRARELDPVGSGGSSIGWFLYQARQYDDAIRELRSVLAVRPDDATAYWFLGYALIANGRPEQAIPQLEKARSLTGGSAAVIGVLVRAEAHAGRRTEALRLVEELKRRQKTGYVPAAAFLNAYLGLDDREQAFAWLERAYQEQSNILQFLKVHPHFDPIRDDPRFSDLLRRVGLDH